MKVILTPFGSSGDVNPFVGIGVHMRERGHHVTVIASGHFADLVESAGLEFFAFGTDQEYQDFINHPDIWEPKKSLPLLYGYIMKKAPRIHEIIGEQYVAGSTVLVAPSFNVGARMAHDSQGIPLATVIPNPILMRSEYSPARSPLLQVPSWTGRWGVKLVYRMVDRKYQQMIGGPLNQFRQSLGLPPVRDIAAWMRSPQQVICLWPDWLYGRQPDWPEHAEATSFVRYDGVSTVDGARGGGWDLPDGDAPVVFTAGTAMSQGKEFFAAAAEACAISGRPGLLLTQRPEQLPDTLPENTRHVAYAPFSELLPKAAAIVHHGGIGTAARATEAGIPQLIVPHAYDQFDNAMRFGLLGLAAELPTEKLSGESMAAALDRLLGSPIIAQRCKQHAGMVRIEEGLDRTCNLIGNLEGADVTEQERAVSSA
jgi:rhamnosyltransferase subunit B